MARSSSTDAVLAAAYRSDSGDLHPEGDRIILAQDIPVGTRGDRPPEAPQFLVVTNRLEELRGRLEGG
jgi:hypothetical protein